MSVRGQRGQRTQRRAHGQRRRSAAAGVLLAMLLLAGACGSARRGEPLTGRHALEDPVLLRGEQVFALRCSQCHPGGEAGLGPAINNKPLPGWLIRFQVRRGLGVMPSFSSDEIPPADLDALVRYLQELRRRAPQ